MEEVTNIEVNRHQGTGLYGVTRAVTGFLYRAALYDLKVEGDIPRRGSRVLMSVHQNSLDSIALMQAVDEQLHFVYNSQVDIWPISKLLDTVGAVSASDKFIQYKRLFHILDRKGVIVNYPQGRLEAGQVSDLRYSVSRLLAMYTGPERPLSVIPVGIEQVTPSRLPDMVPTPLFHFPFFGTQVTVRFGTPISFENRDAEDLTQTVMREAAELSNLPYKD